MPPPPQSPGCAGSRPSRRTIIAEYFRDRGGHALIVYDDLTKHAATHRELSLLARQPPGREAYPGDIFFLHARLLERAAKLSPEQGGGSLTALPIAEIEAGNLSAYIPTNLISISDGQIVLSAQAVCGATSDRPSMSGSASAVSVARRSLRALKAVAGRVRLDYAQYLELRMFSRFGGFADAGLKRRIVHGDRISALLQQARYAPLRPIDQIALLAALNAGTLDTVPLDQIRSVKERLPAAIDAEPDLSAVRAHPARLTDAQTAALLGCVSACDRRYRPATRAGTGMMRRPEDIKARVGNIEQVEGVVVAMHALAAAHAQEARKHLGAIREQEATVARAMGDALALLDAPLHTGGDGAEDGHLRIVVGAAQGFSGSFNERVVTGAIGEENGSAANAFLLIGQRCLSEFESRGIAPVWSANMAAHAAEVPVLASRVVDAVFALLGRGALARASIVYAEPAGVGQSLTVRQLMPFDVSRFDSSTRRDAPLTTLPAPVLVRHLIEEYVFTEICEALMLGFAAENDARMTAMSRARTNVRQIREQLRGDFAQARQEQTTTEIIELSAGQTQSRRP